MVPRSPPGGAEPGFAPVLSPLPPEPVVCETLESSTPQQPSQAAIRSHQVGEHFILGGKLRHREAMPLVLGHFAPKWGAGVCICGMVPDPAALLPFPHSGEWRVPEHLVGLSPG